MHELVVVMPSSGLQRATDGRGEDGGGDKKTQYQYKSKMEQQASKLVWCFSTP